MQDLRPVDEQAFLIRASRRVVLARARFLLVRSSKHAALCAASCFGIAVTALPLQFESEIIASAAAHPSASPHPARIVALMAAEGAMTHLVRSNFTATSPAAGIPTYVGTLQDTWLSAFYGDKERLKHFIEHTAEASGLPVWFFLRLLQQESGLDHRAVSRAGAQGVAQFMPATAAERGLIDPFNPFEAIPKAAEFLREQRAAFGSLGMAAAAYNAGPQRVKNWLAGRSSLPHETRAYVAKITGRSADDWRQGGEMLAVADPMMRD
jgi:soluble lytic murein transglycosylase-like protein